MNKRVIAKWSKFFFYKTLTKKKHLVKKYVFIN